MNILKIIKPALEEYEDLSQCPDYAAILEHFDLVETDDCGMIRDAVEDGLALMELDDSFADIDIEPEGGESADN